MIFVIFFYTEQLNSDFVTFLLDYIESSPQSDEEERVQDHFMTLILSYNLQFQDSDNNIVLESLQSRNDAKVFTEKLLLLLNREGTHLLSCFIYS